MVPKDGVPLQAEQGLAAGGTLQRKLSDTISSQSGQKVKIPEAIQCMEELSSSVTFAKDCVKRILVCYKISLVQVAYLFVCVVVLHIYLYIHVYVLSIFSPMPSYTPTHTHTPTPALIYIATSSFYTDTY